jgi:hypothetical protein
MPLGNITVKMIGGHYGSEVRWQLRLGGSIIASGSDDGIPTGPNTITYEQNLQLSDAYATPYPPPHPSPPSPPPSPPPPPRPPAPNPPPPSPNPPPLGTSAITPFTPYTSSNLLEVNVCNAGVYQSDPAVFNEKYPKRVWKFDRQDAPLQLKVILGSFQTQICVSGDIARSSSYYIRISKLVSGQRYVAGSRSPRGALEERSRRTACARLRCRRLRGIQRSARTRAHRPPRRGIRVAVQVE